MRHLSLLRQNDVPTLVWRNNYVIITSCAPWEAFLWIGTGAYSEERQLNLCIVRPSLVACQGGMRATSLAHCMVYGDTHYTRQRAGCSSGVPLNQNTSIIHFKVYRWELKRVKHVQNIVKIHIILSWIEYCKCCKSYSRLIEVRLTLVSSWFV